MKYTSANPSAIRDEKRLVYYLIITGKGLATCGYQYMSSWATCKAWLRIGNYKQILAVQHKGVNFSVYDYGTPETNKTYASIMDDILTKEGLI